jgi:tricorn protease
MPASRRTSVVVVVPLLAVLSIGTVLAKPGYLRYPDIHGDRIVFASEGDLWIVSDRGGMARRVTSYPGTEYFPHFSPDGSKIAFTGEYDGNRDVYVLPADGGEPRRLTWHPAPDEVVGWTPDGKKVLFRSSAEAATDSSELFAVAAEGGEPEKLPLGWAERIAIDPKTGMWAFNRSSWENATWKRYRGGTAPKIWVGHPDKADFKQVTRFDGPDAFPMWRDGRVYFLSDQGGTANIWSMKPDGSDRKQHTRFKDWDARWPSNEPNGRIVFVLGGDLHVLDPAGDKVQKLDVDLPSERTLTRGRYPEVGRALSWASLSPDGDRLAIVSRGEIFSVPVKEGVTLPVTRGSGARESWASFDAEGKRLVYVTDASREEEIRVIDAWGRGEPKTVLPPGESGWHFPPAFSPDGKWIAYADQTQTLYVIPADGGKPRKVDRGTQAEIREYVFSPDSRWLAYSKLLPTDYSAIFVYDVKEDKTRQVTGTTTSDGSPAWDPEGRYLYFLSDRSTNPVLGSRDFENIEIRNVRPYLLALRKDVVDPFAPTEGMPPKEEEKKDKEKEGKTDEKSEKKEEGKKEDKKDEKKPPKPIDIDFEGLSDRAVEFPVPRGLYFGLAATAKQVFFLSAPVKGFAELPGLFQEGQPENTLMAFEIEKKEAKPFMEGVAGFDLARKGEKIAVMKGRGEIYVVPVAAPPGPELAKSKVSLDGVVIELDPREEWEQIYYEAWRHMRDFYWDPGMGGVDWKAVRDRYATLLPRIATRDELRDLIGETIGELNTSHTYVFGGDPGVQVPRRSTGLLGADLAREGEFFKVVRIYRADPADGLRSPLQEPAVGVKEGDYILAVNRAPFRAGEPFLASLANLADKAVVLTVNGKPTKDGAREAVVKPLGNDSALRYADWVRRNREYVAKKTDGKIGYIHLPDMWQQGLIQFNTWFYPQLDREGMVVDVRWNGGGAVSQMIVERLRRRVISFDRARGGGISTYPYRTLNGPFVVITNEFAGSDGDIFPAAVQLEGLAPVIGMRSWGGVVGIRGDKPLVDGGLLTQPEFAWWDPKQGWSLENRGVIPDIELQNLPQDLAKGVDAQLDRAIQEVMKLHDLKPPVRPGFGPVRDRTRGAFAKEVDAK